jgi:hypothetical protein
MSLLNLSDDPVEIRKEYGKLKRKADFHLDCDDSCGCLFFALTTLIAILTVYLLSRDLALTFLFGLCFAWIPGILIPLIACRSLKWLGLVQWLNDSLDKRKRRRPWFQRYQLLKSEVERLDKIHKEEQDAIRAALDKIEGDFEPTSRRVQALDSFFRQKKKWHSYYVEDEEELSKYTERFAKFLNRIDEATEGRTLDLDLQEHKSSIQSTIRRSQAQCEALFRKFEAMKVWVAPNSVSAGQPVDRVERNQDETPEQSDERNLPLFPTPRTPRTRTDYDRTRIRNLVEVPPPPPPVIRVRAHEALQLPSRSKEEYQRLVGNKQDIGQCGELLAMEYELKRVTESQGIEAARRVVHVSETTDSLGYDISSVLNNVVVFIEVKTTTGGFWTDFFLTANEFAKMEEYKQRYWIYRIHGLDRETGKGLISAFRGIDKIRETFSFEPRVYVSRPRDSETANP